MNILQLAERFEFYCTQNKVLAHVPGDLKNRSFVECDIEELQAAIKEGVKFPCLFLQTPEVEKQGEGDNFSEHYEASFWVLLPAGTTRRSAIYQQAKDICDQVINHMIADADEFFDGGMIRTAEGKIGPTTDRLYGWGVNFGFDQGYDGTCDPEKWEDQ